MALLNNPYNSYKSNKVITANRVDLVVMLYDAAIKFIKEFKICLIENKFQERSKYLDDSLAIIHELKMSINPSYNKKLAGNLISIYNYVSTELTNANINNDPQNLDVLVQVLDEVRIGWVEAGKIEKGKLRKDYVVR
ncbi:MAG: flagellar export chaperone FliS [Candidatus Cloacimonadota bacterium]|nr:MAG: flagellar export chaperone FliS [Candidatus Cloacimonadota bacterium]PIE79355.1 MAG: flagellar export chaperone FliS [Candidatus Delongbacteria bacterium]